MITSQSNERIKQLKSLQNTGKARRETGLFVAEGERIVLEAHEDLLKEVYISRSYKGALPSKNTVPIEEVSDEIFQKVSDTKTPQGILAVLAQPSYSEEDLIKPGGIYLFLETLQDPGNLGTIFRTAEGAGVNGIFMNRGCADIFSPKTVRGTMGSLFRVPFFITEDTDLTVKKLRNQGIKLFAADLSGASDYTASDYRGGTCFCIGNEGNGLSDAMKELSDFRIKIPMHGKLESLNAGVSAAVLLYEARRQRNRS